jgi:hypothetical protein
MENRKRVIRFRAPRPEYDPLHLTKSTSQEKP